MKNWNVPELQELSINATAGGPFHKQKIDGPAIWDENLEHPVTHEKGNYWFPAGDHNIYD